MATLDAEKALDGVNWNFPFSALGRFGFVKSFVNWIEILFASPSATGIASGLTSGRFALRRGTRRGRPLSSSPFTFFVEPLAAAVRRNSLIEGVPTPKNISEYSVDRNKSAILPLHSHSWDVTARSSPIPLCADRVAYRGIKVSPGLSVIKMTVLPKVNSLLSRMPIQPTKSWFKSLDSAIIKFY